MDNMNVMNYPVVVYIKLLKTQARAISISCFTVNILGVGDLTTTAAAARVNWRET
jgi:hypothetical protein